MPKDRELSKLDKKVVDYLNRDCERLKKAYDVVKKEKPKGAEERYYQAYKLVELVAQIHNLSTVADVVHSMFLMGG